MNAGSRIALSINLALIAAGAAAMVYRWVDYRHREGATVAVQRKSGQSAPGTVLSVSRLPADAATTPGPEKMRVCFSIDSFAGIAAKDRSFYESTERARQAAHGPRCEVLPAQQPLEALHPGDRIEVDFTLENGGGIAVSGLFPKTRNP
jgi:hypothetical protein